jgi:ABC-type branched-subunit amino acid transport system ATPase component
MNDIEVNDFVKKYGEIEAVKNISFSVKPGQLFGLIGPDGAGKTTLMRTICTLVVPDSGTILVKGMDVTQKVSQIRSILGYMPQRFSLYQDLTVEQNLQFLSIKTIISFFPSPAIQKTHCRRFIRWNEAETGAFLLSNTYTRNSYFRRAYIWCRSRFPSGVLGNSSFHSERGHNYSGVNSLYG